MSPYVTAYKKNKLVNAVFEQTIVPSHVLNAPMYQEALNELAYIMMKGKSEMAKVQAATSILTHTKAPETTKIELDIAVGTSALDDLNDQLTAVAGAQLKMLKGGDLSLQSMGAMKPKDEDDVIDVEAE